MELPQEITKAVLEADNRALATSGENGINVVPVSTVLVKEGEIWLVNCFFKKTAENVQKDPRVALVCWKGLEGYQIKGKCEYRTDKETLEPVQEWMAKKHPDRTVQAVLVITAEQVYDVAARPSSGRLVWSS